MANTVGRDHVLFAGLWAAFARYETAWLQEEVDPLELDRRMPKKSAEAAHLITPPADWKPEVADA